MISTKTAQPTDSSKSKPAKRHQRRGAARKKAASPNLNKGATRRTTVGVSRKPRKDSKQQICLALLSRPEGATIEDLQKSTGWQPHSVRGFLAGAVKRKLGLALTSEKAEGQPRRYRISQVTA